MGKHSGEQAWGTLVIYVIFTAQKMKFSNNDFFSKYEQFFIHI